MNPKDAAQKETFMATWIMRGLPADNILPKLASVTILSGLAKFTLLNTLKNSPRSWAAIFSVIRKFLMAAKSVLKDRWSPQNVLAGIAKRADLIFGKCARIEPLGNHSSMALTASDGEIARRTAVRSARSLPTALRELSTPL